MGWFQTVSDAVYDALCAVFNVNPLFESSLDRFVPAYVDGVNTPEADRTDNVCYYAVSEDQGTSVDYTMVESQEQDKIVIMKTIPVAILLSFYGPNADDDAETFWSRIQIDTGYDSARSILRRNNIVLRGRPVRPTSIPNVEGSVWRRRCDVRLSLSYFDKDIRPARMVAEIPDVEIIMAD